MHKTLIQTLLAAFCAILATAPLEGGGVMLINMRNAMLSGGKRTPTARDYVQDGLVAMWDGIENAGWGVHDPNATVWKDLSRNGYDLTSASFRWTNNALDDSASNIRLDLGDLSGEFPSAITLSAAMRCPNFRNNAYIFDFYNHSNVGVAFYTSNLLSPYGIRVQARDSTGNSFSNPSAVNPQYQAFASFVWDSTEGILYGNSRPVLPKITTAFTAPPVYFLLGASNGVYNNFRGYVYSLRIYSRALTGNEIAANDAIDKERFNLP